jgi:SAM-dependent methyltransferase
MSETELERGSEPYVLGHSSVEIERLMAQARLIEPITERFFRAAGVTPGMKVLDVGSGDGDVAFLAAALVGERGSVVGVDRALEAVKVARGRAAALKLRNVTFLEGDPTELSFEQPFDAVLGRYVLQFQRDPAAVLRQLASRVRPGGVIVFHELDWSGLSSFPPVATYDRLCGWGAETLRRHGTETRMGAKLHSTFVAAGLPAPTLRLEALIAGGEGAMVWIRSFRDLIAILLPEMCRLGVATAAEVGIETASERMGEEARKAGSVLIGHSQLAAWARA